MRTIRLARRGRCTEPRLPQQCARAWAPEIGSLTQSLRLPSHFGPARAAFVLSPSNPPPAHGHTWPANAQIQPGEAHRSPQRADKS